MDTPGQPPEPTPAPDPRPEAPIQPGLEDCCTSGCVYCVFDMYEEKLEKYKAALAEWEARQAGSPHST
jgi:hypothetical protein